MKKYKVGVVGATGVVGVEMVKTLEVRNFPVSELHLYASNRSIGKVAPFKGKMLHVEPLASESWKSLDIALFSAGSDISKEFAPKMAKNRTFVIDNSSAWRMEPGIPLVVPEVNPESIKKNTHIIANPNCSTIQMVVALKPLHDFAFLKRVIVSTYQAASGAGAAAIRDLEDQTIAWASNAKIPVSKKLPAQIAFNVIPQVDVFLDNKYTKEEMKMVNETRKIMGIKNLPLSATCVRVPVFRGHSEAVWAEFKHDISISRAVQLLSKFNGITLIDDMKSKTLYPLAINSSGKGDVFVGRIRKDLSCKNGLSLWIVSDNLLKGAALNAVQIAELIDKGNFINK
jgi:aspartate-semialdehyde dehydrogenase